MSDKITVGKDEVLTIGNAPLGTVMKPIDEDTKVGMRIFVDGKEIFPKEIVVWKEGIQFQMVYGKDPAGYDGTVIHENLGGGSVVLPHTRIDGRLYVGVIEQGRGLQWPYTVFNAVAGMVKAGSTHYETAKKETDEERGKLASHLASVMVELPGVGGNPNSTWFETGKREGIRSFTQYTHPDALEPHPNHEGFYRFKEGVLEINASALDESEAKTANKILGSVFIPVHEATRLCGDMKTRSAISMLLAWLDEESQSD
jgi:8-oxo-dGTP pyrophosphatase MutT (NUDIX family)